MTQRNVERDEIVAKLVAEGFGRGAISQQTGIHPSAVGRIMERMSRVKAAGYANTNPPILPVPDGFHLSSISTTKDADGNTKSQSFRAKSGAEGDVVPETGSFPAPDGMYVRSVSTLVDGQTGTVKQQWVKSDKLKEDQFAAIEAAVREACVDIVPTGTIRLGYDKQDADLATLYTITDYHIGMLAWAKETGEAWDLKIAEQTLLDVFRRMIDRAPNSAVGIVNFLGDLLHFDSLKPITPEHGHLLDADSRYQKVVHVCVKLVRAVIEMALSKHETVHVLANEGNHDPTGSVWLRVLLPILYADNPRVTFEHSPLPYVVYEWGTTMLAFSHGHMAKKESMPLLFAAKFPQVWGRTTKRYAHTGHMHHVDIKEHPGMKVEQHATLAAPDAYAARGGWFSERQAVAITYSKKTGEFARQTYVP